MLIELDGTPTAAYAVKVGEGNAVGTAYICETADAAAMLAFEHRKLHKQPAFVVPIVLTAYAADKVRPCVT